MNIFAMIFGKRHAMVEEKIAHEKSRSNNNKQAIKSGINLLVHASNALNLVAEDSHAENYRK